VPLDSGARDGGARHGPEEIRRAFPPELRGLNGGERGHPVLDLDFGREHDLERLHVLDLGDLDFRPGESLAVVGARLAKFVVRCADLGATPVVLGGDHSISAFSVAALLERRRALGIIHFDAHHDLYAHPLRQLSHATPFAHLLAHRSLRRLLQIGLRTMERPPPGTRRVRDSRLRYVSARSVARLSPARIFRGMDRELPYYLSFDVDCLDPAFASATATRVIGGLSYPQAVDLVDYAARRFDIVGADFVETSKNGQEFNSAAAASARCVLQLFLSRCRTRRLSSYNFVYPP
jgi:arginase family enzyme